jgi:hypothetical protein
VTLPRFARTRSIGFAFMAVCAALSCNEGVGPTRGMGNYELATFDGAPAPFILSDDRFAAGDRIVVEQVTDSISIQSRSRLIRARSTRVSFYAPDGSLDSASAGWSRTASYTRTGLIFPHQMIITFDAIPSPVPPETLEVASSEVLIGHRLIGGWCKAGPPLECPTEARIREFVYRRQ